MLSFSHVSVSAATEGENESISEERGTLLGTTLRMLVNKKLAVMFVLRRTREQKC